MQTIINILYISIKSNFWGYFFIFLISLLENIYIVGWLMPGAVLLVIAGIFIQKGILNPYTTIFLATIANILGTIISYKLGLKSKRKYKIWNKLFFQKITKLLKTYTFYSILMAKLIPFTREGVGFIAGKLKINSIKFHIFNVVGAILFVILNLGIGYLISFSTEIAILWLGRISFFIILVAVLLISISFLKFYFLRFGLLIYKTIKYIIKKIYQLPIFSKFGVKTYLLIFLFVIFGYIVSAFIGFTEWTFQNNTIATMDKSLSFLMYYFFDKTFAYIIYYISFLGKLSTVIILSIIVGLYFLEKGRIHKLIGLMVSIVSSSIIILFTKEIIHRSRPELSVISELGYSFPSLHAGLSIAFYGYIMYFLIKQTKNIDLKSNFFILGIFIAFIIGFSRIYLNVHYLSDVLGGYFVGIIGVSLGIVVSEISKNKISYNLKVKKIYYFITIVILCIMGIKYIVQTKIHTPKFEEKTVEINNVYDYFLKHPKSKFTTTMGGKKTEPINFIFLAQNDNQIYKIFKNSGFEIADNLNIYTIKNMGLALYDKIPYHTAPMTPLFWNKKVQIYGFQKQDTNNLETRHHIRIWKTNLKQGKYNVYVGVAVFDDKIKWHITHKINPDLNKEREYFISKLKLNKNIQYIKKQLLAATYGKNFSGDDFFSDGYIYIVTIK